MKLRLAVLLLACATAAPVVADQHPHLAKGFDPNRVYHFTDVDAINAFNGNLTVTIPVGQEYSIGGGLTYQLRLMANGKVWDHEERMDLENEQIVCGKVTARLPCVSAFPNRRSNAGMGWTLSLGRLFPWLEQTNASSAWEYESPDGSVHRFYDKFNGAYSHPGVQYTNDGSYLRLKQNGIQRQIEFPNGEVHTFEPDDDPSTAEDDENDDLAPWLLRHIGNRFNTTALTVTYARSGGVITGWTITDGWRSHTVALARMPFESGLDDIPLGSPNWGTAQERMLVSTVTLAAFNGTAAQYTFHYTAATLGRPGWDTIPGTYNDTRAPVQLLSSVGLPDGTSYSFGYHYDGPSGLGGCLKDMTLPTRGRIQWDWGSYSFPERGESSENPITFDRQPGISARHVYGQDGTLIGTWRYTSELQPVTTDPPQVPRYTKTTITAPDEGVTENWFDTSAEKATHATYGLPYNPLQRDASETRFLSQRFTPADAIASTPVGAPLFAHQTYVRYELDAGEVSHRNARVVSTRTRYNTGDPFKTDDDETVDVDKEQFDGYGHYRVVKETVDAGKATSRSRTTTTNYNPGRGVFPSAAFSPFTPTEKWLTATYDSITRTDSSGTEKTTFCFDPDTGVLRKTRRSRNAAASKDLVTLFDYNAATGELEREQYFGGDFTPVPPVLDTTCKPDSSAPPAFEVTHTNHAGSRASSRYTGAGFKSLDLQIDRNTGLPRSSTDSAAVVTTFLYDASSRLREVRPAGSAWTQYEYTPADGTALPASVSVTQWPELASSSAGGELTHVRYHYDGVGRLVQESRRMPDGWSVSSIRYDALDRRTAAYPPLYKASSAHVATRTDPPTKWTYDGQGRVTEVVQPDQSVTRFEYRFGGQATSRGKRTISKVATPASLQTDVVVEERTDGFGRLVQVKENADGQTPFVTTYTYDLSDRLRTVAMDAQTRTFEYDGAGLLTRESHPELDAATTYTYDARGHVKTRVTPAGALSFDYDKAERLIAVTGPAGRLKEFFFDRSLADKSMGKLDRAIRYNRHPNLPGELARVEEKFYYAGPGGRISSKVTTVKIGSEAAPAETYEFSEAYTYDSLGETSTITYPGCTAGCEGFSAPLRAVKTERSLGLPSAVFPYVSGVAYSPGGVTTEIRHLKSDGKLGPIYRQDVDAMGRPVRIEVSKFCEDLSSITVAASPAAENLLRGTQVTITANAFNAAGGTAFVSSWQWYQRGPNGDVPLEGETASVLTVRAGDAASYFVKAANDSCAADSLVVTIVSCDAAAATISAPGQVTASVQERAFAPETAGALYQWSITGGQLVGSTTASSVDFVPGCSGEVVLTVQVTTACGSSPGTKRIDIAPPRAFVGGSRTVSQTGTYDITVDLQGKGPWTVRWADDLANPVTYHSSPGVRPVPVSATTTYTVSSATDARGCPLTIATPSATITVNAGCLPPTPAIEFFVDSVLASTRESARSVTGFASYFWTVTNARIDTSTQNKQTVFFVPGCSGTVEVTLTVTDACGASSTVRRSIAITPPSARVPSPSTLTYVPGDAAPVISFRYAGAVPDLTWSDGFHQVFHQIAADEQGTRPVAPASTTTYRITSVRDAYGCEGTVAGLSTVNVCPRPSAAISAPVRVVALTDNTASVPQAAGATYQWSVAGGTGTIVSGATSSTVVFRGVCGIPVKLSVKVKGGSPCEQIESPSSVEIPVDPPTATLTGSASITQGSSTTLTVALSGPGPWTVTWADIGQEQVTALPYTRTVAPDSTKPYKLTSVTTGGCTATVSGEPTVTVIMPTPGSVVAEATSATSVRVQWAYSGRAQKFDIYRNGQKAGFASTPPFNDSGLPAGTAYVYHVVAVNELSVSAPSARDLATAIAFTRDVAAGSRILAADLLETRDAVNAVRGAAGLAPFAFTDPSLVGARVKAVHVTELRTALAEARAVLGLPAVTHANPDRAAGDLIVARDITDVRTGVR